MSIPEKQFGALDYTVFALMLVVCMLIGVYFAWKDHQKRRQRKGRRGSEALDYLVGGRKMKIFPVAMSLVASLISGIGLLGTSTEIYLFGSGYMYLHVAMLFVGVTLHFVFLPVFHALKMTSMYEYLERRFDKRMRLMGSIMFCVKTIVKIPIMIYVPALAFNQVTGVPIYSSTLAVCVICIFYTCVGGLKAVVWTDVIQGVIMIGAMMLVATKATFDVGGLVHVIEVNHEGGRLKPPNFELDPFLRNSFWSVVIGGWALHISISSVDQSMVQRYVSLPSLSAARKALWIFVAGAALIKGLAMYNGLLLYTMYHDCDPLLTGVAKKKDQLVPLMVMEVLGKYPGLTGCFVAGVFSASLSSLSTGLNSITAVILEDFVKPAFNHQLSEKATRIIMRSTVVLIGCVTTACVFFVAKLGPVLQLAISVAGITYGPLLGVFVAGLFMPWINGRSILTASILSMISTTYIVLRAQHDIARGILTFPILPTSTDGCDYAFNGTTTLNATIEEFSGTRPIHHISYMYYTAVGFVLTLIFANCGICVFGKQDPAEIDENLLTPMVRQFYYKKQPVAVHDDELMSPIHEVTNIEDLPERVPLNGEIHTSNGKLETTR